MTKEKFESDVFKYKKQIMKQRKLDIVHRLMKFQTVDEDDYKDFKQAIIYFLFIIVFVVMITLQLDIIHVSFMYITLL